MLWERLKETKPTLVSVFPGNGQTLAEAAQTSRTTSKAISSKLRVRGKQTALDHIRLICVRSKEPLEVDEIVRRIVAKVGLGFNLPMPKPVLFGLRGLQNEENVVAASRHLTPICRGKWRSLGEDIGTTDLLAHNQDVVGTFLWCKLLALKEVVGANGFEPSTSWSRTSLDQTKSVELTAFACAFPPLIWATWATKYRWPQFGTFTLADRPVDLPCLFHEQLVPRRQHQLSRDR